MPMIATLTMNPTIDVAYGVNKIVPTHKIRATSEYHNPGGGGINVARVLNRLACDSHCYYLSGGATGIALDGMLVLHNLAATALRIAGETRIAANVLEAESGLEFRFVPAGPTISEQEWRDCLDRISSASCDILVASGSLPNGVPDDFYAQLGQRLTQRGIRFILDSSGLALQEAVAAGGLYLLKPSIGELRQLVGQDLPDIAAIGAAAKALTDSGKVEILAATLGHQGALLAYSGKVLYRPAISVEAKSTVGAGDSFVAGMVAALATGETPEMAFAQGIAAGTAAVLRPGTDLARPDDIKAMRQRLDESDISQSTTL